MSTLTTPHITLFCKNRDLPEGSKMVLEYFSQPPLRAINLQRELVERIPLPPLARSRSYTVDAKGVTLTKTDSYNSYSGHYITGRDFYGLIISLFDSGNHLLFQQCAPVVLASQCSSKPAEPGRADAAAAD